MSKTNQPTIGRYIQLPYVRYGAMAAISSVVTVALFFLMHSLIEFGSEAVIDEGGPNRVIEFVRL